MFQDDEDSCSQSLKNLRSNKEIKKGGKRRSETTFFQDNNVKLIEDTAVNVKK